MGALFYDDMMSLFWGWTRNLLLQNSKRLFLLPNKSIVQVLLWLLFSVLQRKVYHHNFVNVEFWNVKAAQTKMPKLLLPLIIHHGLCCVSCHAHLVIFGRDSFGFSFVNDACQKQWLFSWLFVISVVNIFFKFWGWFWRSKFYLRRNKKCSLYH